MSVSSSIAKSGWLYRQSSMLKKWRRYWFSLTQDGYLRYFETELSSKAEDVLNIPVDCTAIMDGTKVQKIQPPDGKSILFLLKLESRNGHSWIICGDNQDDTKAWQMALQEARLIRHHVSLPSSPMPGATIYRTAAPVTVMSADDMAIRHVYTYPGRSITYTTTGTPVYYTGYPHGDRYTYVYHY